MLICLIPVWFEASKIQFAPQTDKLLATDQRQQETFSKLRGILDNQDVLVVSMHTPRGVFSPEGLSALHEVSETLMSLEGATDIKSLTHSYKPVRSGFSFQMVPLATTNTLDIATLKKLEDHTNCAATPGGNLCFTHFMDRCPVDKHFASSRVVNACDDVGEG